MQQFYYRYLYILYIDIRTFLVWRADAVIREETGRGEGGPV